MSMRLSEMINEQMRRSPPDLQLLEYERELKEVKASKFYKRLDSINQEKGGLKKIFTYHYAEEKKWHLGSGSYGQVYVCYFEEVVTSRVHKFALKTITIPSSLSEVKKIEDRVATTRQQIRSLIKLRQNQNIIKIEDVIGDRENRRLFMVLQYCNNKDLTSFFEHQRKMGFLKTEDQILMYFKQLLNAFQDLYKYNIIHRDIKPQNIFVHNKILKIGDFGLSQQLFEKKENLHDNRTIGTLLTSAPQLIFKEPYTNKCDIYSLGLVLYWMIFEKYPFYNFDKEQFLKESLNLDVETEVKCSPEVGSLIKSMLAYKEDDRIDWHDLFAHPIFQRLRPSNDIAKIRDTIGRNLVGQNLNLMLQHTIPTEFYRYIGDETEIEMTGILGTLNEKGATQSFKTVVMEGVNFNFKINFLKLLLKQIFQTGHEEKIKNKIEFSIIKDLLRLGVQTYINYLNEAFVNELNGLSSLHILDLRMLTQIGGSKHFQTYVEKFKYEAEQYQDSHKRPKLSKQEREGVQRNCEKYEIKDQFHLLLDSLSDDYKLLVYQQAQFLEEIKRCIVELIYFVKQEIRFYSHQKDSLTEAQMKRYRQLILLIHHMNMFILLHKIFPEHYDEEIDYDTEKFEQNELYMNNHSFKNLARQVNEIVARFQN